MKYRTAHAFRVALERRLLSQSNETGVDLARLRRRVLFERIVARLERAEPGLWVVKGGMALEIRLRDDARLTRDIDLGLRDVVSSAEQLHERLIDALVRDLDGDRFILAVRPPVQLGDDGSGHVTWRARVAAQLAGKPFDGVQLDVSPRRHELHNTDSVPLANVLAFAGVPTTVVEIVDIHRHAAEKFHAMLRVFGNRENTRVRDLVDLVILIEHNLLDPITVAARTMQVFRQRDAVDPPTVLPPMPGGWPGRYEQMAADHDLEARLFPAGVAHVQRLWAEMFPLREP